MAENARISGKDDGRILDMGSGREATIDDLYHVEGKAEIVNGELVLLVGDRVGFVVNLPNRRSFCPDAAFCTQPLTSKFIDGAPICAVEVRSDEDDGPAAERAMTAKRADYFAAGTQVVWDVDVLREHVVRVYRASDPVTPTIYRGGERAEAEPALPGWSMPVDDLFPR
jgi:Uma2 family endonuclease